MEDTSWEEWAVENPSGETIEGPAMPTALMERHLEWAPPIEEQPSVVEGEFREIPLQFEPKREETKEGKKRRKELEEEAGRQRKFEREMEGLTEKEALAKRQATLASLKEAKGKYAYIGRERTRKEVGTYAKAAQKIATLGGVPMGKEARKELYFGRVKGTLYTPKAPSSLSSKLQPIREVSEPEYEILQRESTPRLGRLQEEGAPRSIEGEALRRTPLLQAAGGLVSLKGQGVALGLLRKMTMPQGLMPIERYAYAEILGNNDRDTMRHISSELAAIGVSRKDSEQAVKSLLSKGLVKKTYEARGEKPIYEVTR
jgi:hypothetical protein